MKPQNLKEIISQLETPQLEEKATFGIYQYGGGPDESCIKANKEGMLLFAIHLLNAVEADDNFSTTVTLPSREDWIAHDSDTVIDWIEVIRGNRRSKEEPEAPAIGKLFAAGCVLAIIGFLGSTLIGFFTFVGCFF